MILKRVFFTIAYCLILSFTISCVVAPPPKKDVVSPETQMREVESSKQMKLMNEKILMSAYHPKGILIAIIKSDPRISSTSLSLRMRN